MYSHLQQVNMLTSLLLAHGIEHAVLCPGSHNAPIVHNLHACKQIQCYAVTDERSAGFIALGIALQLSCPVVVCVTSGSALLNLLPAVAEAFYQQVPLIVISADRPQAWIGQLQGQTLPQAGALEPFVKVSVNIPEPENKTLYWHANRLMNEALTACNHHGEGPVHINIPLTGPLHIFDTPSLPTERVIRRFTNRQFQADYITPLVDAYQSSSRRMIVVGQLPRKKALALSPIMERLAASNIILCECLGAHSMLPCPIDAIIEKVPSTPPEFILYLGGTLVSNPLKQWLRNTPSPCWVVNQTGDITDVTGQVVGIVEGMEIEVMQTLLRISAPADSNFLHAWKDSLSQASVHCRRTPIPWSQAWVVRSFEKQIATLSSQPLVCYANSSSVRLGNLFAQTHRACNRGVNGIEGSLSTAVGMALSNPEQMVYCVIGDLSFFYDHNGLWTTAPLNNLRILLLNNAGGGIFTRFEGLKESQAKEPLIMACHQTTAEGICASYHAQYLCAENPFQLEEKLEQWMSPTSSLTLLEVFTNMYQDQKALDILHHI